MLPVAIKFLSDVAIPLGQGQVFNHRNEHDGAKNMSRNPFGSGTGF